MSWTCRKKSSQSNNFWVSYGPFKYVYINIVKKKNFSGITPKILTSEYYAKNKTYSKVNLICVHQDWSILIEKCPPYSVFIHSKLTIFFKVRKWLRNYDVIVIYFIIDNRQIILFRDYLLIFRIFKQISTLLVFNSKKLAPNYVKFN